MWAHNGDFLQMTLDLKFASTIAFKMKRWEISCRILFHHRPVAQDMEKGNWSITEIVGPLCWCQHSPTITIPFYTAAANRSRQQMTRRGLDPRPSRRAKPEPKCGQLGGGGAISYDGKKIERARASLQNYPCQNGAKASVYLDQLGIMRKGMVFWTFGTKPGVFY